MLLQVTKTKDQKQPPRTKNQKEKRIKVNISLQNEKTGRTQKGRQTNSPKTTGPVEEKVRVFDRAGPGENIDISKVAYQLIII